MDDREIADYWRQRERAAFSDEPELLELEPEPVVALVCGRCGTDVNEEEKNCSGCGSCFSC